MYQNFIIPSLYEAQHASGDTPPIIRSLKLHKQPLVLRTWKVVGRAVVGRCQVAYAGHAVAQLVEALRYKLEGRGFDSRCCHWTFSLT